MSEDTYIYIFSCPLHGPESQVFCFRAFAEENTHLWGKYRRTLEKVDFETGELQRMLEERKQGK